MFGTVAGEVAQVGRANLHEPATWAIDRGRRSETPPPRGRQTDAESSRPGPRPDSGPWSWWA